MINTVVVGGLLSKYHRVMNTRNGKRMASFSLYQKRKDFVQYVPILAFDREAEFFERTIKDGMFLIISGYISVTSDTDASGKKTSKVSIIANQIDIGDPARMQQAQQAASQAAPQMETRKPAQTNERFSNDLFSRADEFGTAGLEINPDDLPF